MQEAYDRKGPVEHSDPRFVLDFSVDMLNFVVGVTNTHYFKMLAVCVFFFLILNPHFHDRQGVMH